jgi:UDP-N-acetyl-D-glucosamine/UDP-N-acetyl-D-galactosamine dehydrogenase
MPAPPALPDIETVGIIGLGYVGLPLAMTLARSGLRRVVGFDINPTRIAELNAGHDRTREVTGDQLKAALDGALSATTDDTRLDDLEAYIVTVPTPVDAANQPNLAPLYGACRTIGTALSRRSSTSGPPIVVFESTVYPGVTEDICGPAIEAASGRRAGRDFLLGYSPERINPGDRTHTVDRIAKVVSGQTPEVAQRLAALYGRVTNGGIFVARDIRTAEAAKVIENAQRDLNIAFINEITMIFGRLGLSIYDVLEAARTKWNFLDFKPGLVGGHCIGIDPYYLAACAQAAGHEPEIILAGRRINDGMGDHFAARIAGQCRAANPRTLVLGLTFKENLPDLRNSKVVDLVHGLAARGHRVDVHDAHADAAEAQATCNLSLLPSLPNGAVYDCLVGAVPHEAYRGFDAKALAGLVKPGGLVADIKGMWRSLDLPEALRRWQP